MCTLSSLESNAPALTIGRTRAPVILRAVGDQLLLEEAEEAAMWQGIDPVIGAVRAAEAEKVARLIALVMPADALRGDFRLKEERS